MEVNFKPFFDLFYTFYDLKVLHHNKMTYPLPPKCVTSFMNVPLALSKYLNSLHFHHLQINDKEKLTETFVVVNLGSKK